MVKKDKVKKDVTSSDKTKSIDSAEGIQGIPLSSESMAIIPDVIKLFYLVAINVPLYPPGSDMIVKPLEELHAKLLDVFKQDEKIMLSSVKSTLFVNGKRLKEGEIKRNIATNFLRFFSNLHLETISLSRGITQQELEKFITLLYKGSGDRNITEVFAQENVTHIAVDEIKYDPNTRGKKSFLGNIDIKHLEVLEHVARKISAVGNIDNLLNSIQAHPKETAEVISELSDKVAQLSDRVDQASDPMKSGHIKQAYVVLELLQQLGQQLIDEDPKDWKKCKSGLAKTFSNLAPDLRGQALVNVDEEDNRRLVGEILSELQENMVVKMFADALKDGNASAQRLRYAIRKLLKGDPKKERLIVPIRTMLTKSGLSEKEVHWITEEKAFEALNLDEKVEKIVSVSFEDYRLLRDEIDIVSFCCELVGNNQLEFFDKIIERWSQHCSENSYEARSLIAGDCIRLIKEFSANDSPTISKVAEPVIILLKSEKELQYLKELLARFTDPLNNLINSQNYGIIASICGKLKREIGASAEDSQHRTVVAQWQESIFPAERIKSLVEQFVKKTDKNDLTADIISLFAAIDEPAISALVEAAMTDEETIKTLGYFDAYVRRRVIAEALAGIIERNGSQSAIKIFESHLKDSRLHIVKNTVELIADIPDSSVIALLVHSLRHGDENIRRKAVFLLGKIGNAQAVSLLNEAFCYSSGDVRREIIIALGRVGDIRSLSLMKDAQGDNDTEELMRSINLIEGRLNTKTKE